MNANEVIATLASVYYARQWILMTILTMVRAANDVIFPARYIVSATLELNRTLLPALVHLRQTIIEKRRSLKRAFTKNGTYAFWWMPWPFDWIKNFSCVGGSTLQDISDKPHVLESKNHHNLLKGHVGRYGRLMPHPGIFAALFAEARICLHLQKSLSLKGKNFLRSIARSQGYCGALFCQLKPLRFIYMKNRQWFALDETLAHCCV